MKRISVGSLRKGIVALQMLLVAFPPSVYISTPARLSGLLLLSLLLFESEGLVVLVDRRLDIMLILENNAIS